MHSGEPFRYAVPKTLQAKYSRLRVRATGQRRRGGVAKGTPRSANYGQGRTCTVPSLPQVLLDNRLPQIGSLPPGETLMLEQQQLDGFYRELQTAQLAEKCARPKINPGTLNHKPLVMKKMKKSS